MVFANVSVQGWIINPYLYSSSVVLGLPPTCTVVVNICVVTFGVEMVINWNRGLQMFLNLSPNVLADSPMYFSSYFTLAHLYWYITPPFCVLVCLSLGTNSRRFLMVMLPPLKYTCIPHLLQMFLPLSLSF